MLKDVKVQLFLVAMPIFMIWVIIGLEESMFGGVSSYSGAFAVSIASAIFIGGVIYLGEKLDRIYKELKKANKGNAA